VIPLDSSWNIDVAVVELGDHLLRASVAVERGRLQERAPGDDDAGGVLARVADLPLERLGQLEQLLGLRSPRDLIAQLLRGRVGLVERDVERVRHRLREPIDVGEGDPHHPAHVAQGRLRLHGAEGDDAGDPAALLPLPVVLLLDVAQDLAAAVHAEVGVDVRHRDPLGVQEALEGDPVLHRIDVHDSERVGRQAARRGAAPRADRDAALAGEADEVPDDQEVARVPAAGDDVELVAEPLLVLPPALGERGLGVAQEPLREAPARQLLEVAVDRLARGRLELGELELAGLEHEAAALRDLERVPHRARHVVEELQHLGGVLDVEALPVELEALGVIERLPGLNAEQRLVRMGVMGLQVVGVVGRDQRDPELLVHVEQLAVHGLLRGDPVALELEVEPISEDAVEGLELLPRLAHAPVQDRVRDGRREAAGGRDQALVVLPQELEVDARLVVEALQIAPGDQAHQVPVPLIVHGEQEEVVHPVEAARLRIPIEAGPLRHVDLAADDRLDAASNRRLVELDRPEQVPVVGHRDGGHARRLRALHQLLDGDGAVEDRVLGMQVEVRELCPAHVRLQLRAGPRCREPDRPNRLTPIRWSRGACSRCRRPRGSRPRSR
jgi:hypothetical protein